MYAVRYATPKSRNGPRWRPHHGTEQLSWVLAGLSSQHPQRSTIRLGVLLDRDRSRSNRSTGFLGAPMRKLAIACAPGQFHLMQSAHQDLFTILEAEQQ